MTDKQCLFPDSYSPKSLEPTDAGACTVADYKVEVLELVPGGKSYMCYELGQNNYPDFQYI